uniref:PQ-loop repeat-containing protein 1 n=1 Tax=Panagrolaimus sp. JU765 TaxID=591449 RepID=A0AC34QS96_9BILA
MVLIALAATFMVIGGAIPYLPQYIEIHQRKSALGFSLLVCLALCAANILRILFWFGKRFEVTLLVQSVVMITCMILMLEISVRMNRRTVPLKERTSVWNSGPFGPVEENSPETTAFLTAPLSIWKDGTLLDVNLFDFVPLMLAVRQIHFLERLNQFVPPF